jgi:hypothetical protein
MLRSSMAEYIYDGRRCVGRQAGCSRAARGRGGGDLREERGNGEATGNENASVGCPEAEDPQHGQVKNNCDDAAYPRQSVEHVL